MNKFEADTEVLPETLLKAGLIKTLHKPVKLLGNGEIDRPLVIKVHKHSSSAEKKITAAGGRIESI